MFALERVDAAHAKEALRDFPLMRKPVIVAGAVDDWPATRRWTPEFWTREYGRLSLPFDGRDVSVAEQMERIFSSTDENPAPYPYNLDIERYFPELLPDVLPGLVFGHGDRSLNPLWLKRLMRGNKFHEVFFSGRGSRFNVLHYDTMLLETQITQIYGDKEFLLYDPGQTPLLYPRTDIPKLSQVDPFNPDLERFPRFAEARAIRFTLRQGETVYFPCGWWHTTYTPGPCISYGRALLHSANWDAFLSEHRAAWTDRPAWLSEVLMTGYRTIGFGMSVVEALRPPSSGEMLPPRALTDM